MLTKNQLKYYADLHQKKNRMQENKFIVEGKRLVEEVLSSKYECELLIYTLDFIEKHNDFLKKIEKYDYAVVKNQEFSKLSDTENPQGVAGIFKMKNKHQPYTNNLIIALENINDPGNLGTLIRTCEWFGLNDIIIHAGSADIYNSKVLRSSMGALFHTNINYTANFYNELKKLKKNEFLILCADMDGKNLYRHIPNQKSVIVFCNEANGPSEELLSVIDERITIPKFGKVESLNVASASAVIISHFVKNLSMT